MIGAQVFFFASELPAACAYHDDGGARTADEKFEPGGRLEEFDDEPGNGQGRSAARPGHIQP
jgi:hypothetical protein